MPAATEGYTELGDSGAASAIRNTTVTWPGSGDFATFVTRAAARRGILPAMQFGREWDARTIETQR
jgi:hypothetical protein